MRDSGEPPGPGQNGAVIFPASMPTKVRVLMVACFVGAIAIFVGAYLKNGDPSGNNGCNQPAAIEVLYPACNTLAFQQAPVGVDMAPGYKVDLTVNGQPIPLDQIDNRQGQSAVDAKTTPDVFIFTPGPGKVLERLPAGPVSAVVSYRKLSENDATAKTFRWTFTVS